VRDSGVGFGEGRSPDPLSPRPWLRSPYPLLALGLAAAAFIAVLLLARPEWAALAFAALTLAVVAFLGWRWAGVRAALLQRVAELSTIEAAGRAIAEAELDVDEIARLMYESVQQVADASIFHLGLFDGDAYTLRLWIHDGELVPPQTFQMSPGVGLVNWLRETRQPLLVRDFARDMDSLPARPAYVSDDPPRSALFVPLVAGEQVIGTMSAQSFRPGAYGEGERRVLSAMANQAALALQKAWIYEQERRRARQLATIGEVTRQVTATLELNQLFERVVRLIRSNFGYYHVAIFAADPARQVITFEAGASAGDRVVNMDVGWGQGLIGWVAAHGEPVLVNDVSADARYRAIDALEETRSELAVPLLLEKELVGVLDVQSDGPAAFGPDDLFILETLGLQVAIAIQVARLYAAEQQQAWLATALLQVADAMSQVGEMDAVLTTIVRLTPLLAGVDRCAILLWEPAVESFRPAQTHGLSQEQRELFEAMAFPRGSVPALDLVSLDRNPLLVRVEEQRTLLPHSLAGPLNICEVLLLPLLAQGDLLGIMMVDYAGRPHHFDERILNMLGGIANQAAMVLQTARLVQAQQEEAYVSMALLQVAEAVHQSTDLDDTLATIVRITPILLGVEASAILLWQEEAAAHLPSQQHGLKGPPLEAFRALRLGRDDPVVAPLLRGAAMVSLQEAGPSSPLTAAMGRDAVLALPLATKGKLVGIMAVDYTGAVAHFTERWLSILTGIAGQAALAVENHRLLQESAEQERIRQELEVARRIQASFLPDCCPQVPGWELAAVWRSARQVGGDFYDFIPLPANGPGGAAGAAVGSRRLGLVVADVADKGVPAALFMALSRTLMRTVAIDGRPPALALSRANDLIVADARTDLFVTLFYAVLDAGSGEVVYAMAGHVPALLVRMGSGQVQELRAPGMAMGILPDVHFEERRVHLNPGDVLVCYTDGVTDAMDGEHRTFGRERLAGVVQAHRHRPAADLALAIEEAVDAFAHGAAQFDDLTLLIAKCEAGEPEG
jgi:serine phosphatase RsbU (regulator of sigma subunit)/putative methionine-R-sulfoxide reductase with GAF domain